MSRKKDIILAAAYALAHLPTQGESRPARTPRQLAVDAELLQEKKGLRPYTYEQGTLYALNQKNADRKARQKGWLV